MAKKTVVMRVCDLHRGNVEAVKTVTMSWNRRTYHLDLCDQHFSEVDSAIGKWTSRPRPSTRTTGRSQKATAKKRATRPAKRGGRKRASASNNSAQVREWAQANGLAISSRGRIPGEVRAAYDAAKK
jgi:hypothetical protein